MTRQATRLAVVLAFAFMSGTSGVAATPNSVTFDSGKSRVEFTLGDVLHTLRGSFRLTRGEVLFDLESGKASGEIVIDARSGDSGSEARDSRMKKNILETDKYPDIRFLPDQVRGPIVAEGDSHLDVHGIFRIHGADHEVTLPVEVAKHDGQMRIRTHFDVPYVQWGMKNPSTFILRVDKTVRIDIDAVGTVLQAH